MAKFVELSEAARILGISPEKLVEMRSNGDIHGYRDGGSWKFKQEEIDRVAAELGGGGDNVEPIDDGQATIPFDSLDDLLSPDDAPKGEDSSILVSEQELGQSESTSSTIIGKSGGEESADSDLKLTSESSDLSLGSDLEVNLGGEPDLGSGIGEGSGIESDVTLVPGIGTDSDVSLVPDPGSDRELASADSGGSELDLDAGTGEGTGNLPDVGSDLGAGSSDLDLSLDSELALSDDDDIVLGGSDTGSDLSLGADSGINLASPSDSGLSLEADSGISLQSPTDSGLSLDEEPLDLAGSSISSLELPEDEDLAVLEESHPALEETAAVMKDEDFLLSPADEMLGDESDSGSQVIALEDSAAFDQDAAGMFAEGQGAILQETAGLEAQLDSLGAGAPAAPIAAGAAGPAPAYAIAPELPEAPYSVWNLLGLTLILLFLCVTGILMTDIVQNMWAWEEARDVSTSISEGITGAFGL